MALIGTISLKSGASASYHKIYAHQAEEGGSLQLWVRHYLDSTYRAADAPGIILDSVITFQNDEWKDAAATEIGQTPLAIYYALLKTKPEYAEMTDELENAWAIVETEETTEVI